MRKRNCPVLQKLRRDVILRRYNTTMSDVSAPNENHALPRPSTRTHLAIKGTCFDKPWSSTPNLQHFPDREVETAIWTSLQAERVNINPRRVLKVNRCKRRCPHLLTKRTRSAPALMSKSRADRFKDG